MLRKSPQYSNGIKRVQVGVGPKNILNDWWNVDIRYFKGIDEVMDVTKPWPWKNTLDYVFGEHFLEHITFKQAIDFLVEAGNALKKGGTIRLSTPSLEWVLKTHFTFEQNNSSIVVDQTFNLNRGFHGWGHQFLYSKEMLEYVLSEIGYEDIKFCKYGESEITDLKNLERHGGYSVSYGFPSVWIVEGTRKDKQIMPSHRLIEDSKQKIMKYIESGH